MNAAPLTYGQSINNHYEVIVSEYIQQKHELAPTGWKKVMLRLPSNAVRIEDPKEQSRFMEELLRLVRTQCSTTDAKSTHTQGLIVDLNGSEAVDQYLPGLKAILYPGKPSSSVWIEAAPVAGPMDR
jgi:hypothetical protein